MADSVAHRPGCLRVALGMGLLCLCGVLGCYHVVADALRWVRARLLSACAVCTAFGALSCGRCRTEMGACAFVIRLRRLYGVWGALMRTLPHCDGCVRVWLSACAACAAFGCPNASAAAHRFGTMRGVWLSVCAACAAFGALSCERCRNVMGACAFVIRLRRLCGVGFALMRALTH